MRSFASYGLLGSCALQILLNYFGNGRTRKSLPLFSPLCFNCSINIIRLVWRKGHLIYKKKRKRGKVSNRKLIADVKELSPSFNQLHKLEKKKFAYSISVKNSKTNLPWNYCSGIAVITTWRIPLASKILKTLKKKSLSSSQN